MILRLQSSWEIRKKEGNVIEISSSFRKKKYEIKSENPSIFLFLNSLSKGIQYPEDLPKIAEKFGLKENSLHSLISKFKSYGIFIEDDKSPSPTLETLYDRQIRFFRTFENQTTSGEQINENLQNRTVLIVGLGGYGSWVALLCARMGIRNIIGIDFDRVEISNLHRQILYDRGDLGSLKIHACEKRIKEADSEINFVGHCLKVGGTEDLYPFMENIDLVFNPFSYLPSKKASDHPSGMIAQAAMIKGKPCLTFGGSWIGPLTIPSKSICYFCAIKALELNGNLDPELRNQNIQKRAFAPPIATCCSMAVHEASRFLSGCDDSQVLDGMIQLDMFAFSNSRYLPLEPSSECCFCNTCETNNFKVTS
ncbi:ThiF family adenylyltransferase [Candidatus Protochlamydia phocaeensis]|uniref:ThiF family adenylyltransferase n=1 Tax=Candidatus Protochlamydia phocaeensis TaxID=1414722 RepID=UPI000838CB8F|nr:ThiF family adenylyltransferase [Candidatus Protochlamydia phocaeensis]